jgi:hypothetical protein
MNKEHNSCLPEEKRRLCFHGDWREQDQALNCHSRRHIGQWGVEVWLFTHLRMQCRWYAWLHTPHISGQSSPGNLQSGQQPSKAIRHMPHVSSCASHVHDPTACHCSIFTFILRNFFDCRCELRLLFTSLHATGIMYIKMRRIPERLLCWY